MIENVWSGCKEKLLSTVVHILFLSVVNHPFVEVLAGGGGGAVKDNLVRRMSEDCKLLVNPKAAETLVSLQVSGTGTSIVNSSCFLPNAIVYRVG